MKILRWISAFPVALRWVLVLPTALLVPTIIIAGLNLMLLLVGLVDWRWSFSLDKSFMGLVVEYAFFGLISIYSGVLMAPFAKKAVAIVLASLFYIYLGVQIYVVVTFSEAIVSSLPVVYGIVGAAAASYAVFQVFRDEELPHLFQLDRS